MPVLPPDWLWSSSQAQIVLRVKQQLQFAESDQEASTTRLGEVRFLFSWVYSQQIV